MSLLTHSFVSSKADSADTSKVRKTNWNDDHVFGGGNSGSLLVRDASVATYGANWVQSVATGKILASAGAGTLPAWSATPQLTGLGLGAAALSNAGLFATHATGPSAILRSGSVAESNSQSPLVITRGADGTVATTFIDAFGGINTVAAIRLLGNAANMGTVAADGTFSPVSTAGNGLSTMLDVYSDTTLGAVIRSSATGGAYALQVLDHNGSFAFSIEEDGALLWGAAGAGGTATHAAMDARLARIAADTLAVQRGANATNFRIYGNTAFLQLSCDTVNAQIGGSGINNVSFGKLLNWTIAAGGGLKPETHNTYDIGVSASSQAPRNIFVGSSLVTKTKAGTPTDSDVTNAADGMSILDTSAGKIWYRTGGAWKFATLS